MSQIACLHISVEEETLVRAFQEISKLENTELYCAIGPHDLIAIIKADTSQQLDDYVGAIREKDYVKATDITVGYLLKK